MANLVTNSAVHVWQVALDQPAAVVADSAALLSADEAARAARFIFARDRSAYTVARAALRRILARGLGLQPTDVRFSYSSAGKPALSPLHTTADAAGLAFNLSHSHTLALIAVGHGRAVGVDIEYHRDLPDLMDIAHRFFSPRESARLRALPAAEQAGAFFRCWTRKEAYLKARGQGLMAGLDRFDVSFEPGEPAALLSTLDDPAEAARWSLLDLRVPPHYSAAVAVTGPPPRVEPRRWAFTLA